MISPIAAWPTTTEHQVMHGVFGTDIRSLELPSPDADVLPGVAWGNFDVLFTPAFWAGRMWLHAETNTPSTFRLGSTLAEEVVACLLGGHGLPAAVGLAAYERLKSVSMCAGTPTAQAIEEQLLRPLTVQGRQIRYRFPRQRASFVARALGVLARTQVPDTDLALRNFLISLPGIGPKTASWITRNWLGSDRVAIIDIHIQRAGVLAGFFKPAWTPARHYRILEEQFLIFAQALGVKASLLDNLIWQEMRVLSRFAGRVDA